MKKIVILISIACLVSGCSTPSPKPSPSPKISMQEELDLVMKDLNAGKQRRAEERLAILPSMYPREQRVLLMNAICARSRWSRGKADSYLVKVVAIDPETTEGICAKSIIGIDRGIDTDKHFTTLKQLITNNPDDHFILWTMGIMAREHHQDTGKKTYGKEGIKAYKQLLALFEVGPVMAHHTYANILTEETADPETALHHRKISLQLEPCAWTYQGLANTLVQLDRYEEANEACEKMIKLRPNDASYLQTWGVCLFWMEKYDDVIEKLELCVKIDPRKKTAWHYLARCLEKKERHKDLLHAYIKGYECGDIRPPNKIGQMYESGTGMNAPDYNKAAKWYIIGANLNDPEAIKSLGCLYMYGKGVKKDHSKALELCRESADLGCRNGIASMAFLYEKGWGVQQDYLKAAEWYRKAADAGSPGSMFKLARFYAYGNNKIKIDKTKALEWYIKAGNKGHKLAMLDAGTQYKYGRGTKKDHAEAYKWYIKALESDDTRYDVFSSLWSLYQHEKGKKPETKELIIRCNKGIRTGDLYDINMLGWTYATCKEERYHNPAKALQFALMVYNKDKSNPFFMDTLAAAYARNKNFEKAVEMQKKSISIFQKMNTNKQRSGMMVNANKRLELYKNKQPYTSAR